MLKRLRVYLAAIFFALVTLLFLDFTGSLHSWLGWLAKIQFLPALLAFNFGVIIFLVLATLIFGRLYCSIICPLGVFQDVVSRFGAMPKGRKYRFGYSPNMKWLRWSLLALLVVAIVAGLNTIVVMLAPYSSYGRIASNLFAPVWQGANNVLAHFAERYDSYLFYHKSVYIKSLATFVIAAVTFVVVGVLAWRNGRTYCNTICPVGTVLGYLSKFSLLKPYFDMEKCNSCGLCERNCKAACINTKVAQIDYSRCVTCFNCVDICSQGAMKYGRRSKVEQLEASAIAAERSAAKEAKKAAAKAKAAAAKAAKEASTQQETPQEVCDQSKRKTFLATTMLLAASAAKASSEKVDGGYAVIVDKKVPKRKMHIVPPGAKSPANFASKCTGCQLCVSVCPNGVLRPSTSLSRLMQPEASYERGFCRPECTKCSQVCPAGAITPITCEEKSAIQVGRAVFIKKNCVVMTDDVDCGNCASRCPSGAIIMVPNNPKDISSRKIPSVNAERCIGCGACENLCPAAPFSAIYVEGNNSHITI